MSKLARKKTLPPEEETSQYVPLVGLGVIALGIISALAIVICIHLGDISLQLKEIQDTSAHSARRMNELSSEINSRNCDWEREVNDHLSTRGTK